MPSFMFVFVSFAQVVLNSYLCSFVLTSYCTEEAKANLALFVAVPAQQCHYTACIVVVPVQDNPCRFHLGNAGPTELQ